MNNDKLIPASLMTMAILLVAALAQFPTAAGHTCSSNNHGGCNGHSCGATGGHDHTTNHWYGDHWCISAPGVGALYGPTNAIQLESLDIDPVS